MTFLLVNYIFPLPKKKIAMFLQEKDIFIFPFVSAKNIFFSTHIVHKQIYVDIYLCVQFHKTAENFGPKLEYPQKGG